MAVLTYTAQLEEVQAAITKVMGGQEYTIGNRSLKRADLQWLHERERYLRPLALRESGDGGVSLRRGVFSNGA